MISSAILKVENEILRVLCFDFSVVLPYAFLMILGKRIKLEKEQVFEAIRLVNAIYFEPFCIFHSAPSIAVAAIHKVMQSQGEERQGEFFNCASLLIPSLKEQEMLEISKRLK